ncbi:ABC transporter permease [Amycolatopsis sp. GM8]|uniref:ABC transporter permease n=1 Tax=Amycolatopsis sp. GM8 TaxID=2896530 RepID=UPI001F47EB9E|nr:ABC transporter permease [Amycolatopsis sp. GM8]
MRFGQSNLSMIGDRIGATALLTGTALFLAALIGIPLGMLAALHAGRLIDRVTSGIAVLGQSIPVYWLGLVMVLVFAVRLGWFPVGQFTSLWSLVLPAMALATLPLAQIARITRASMMTSLNAPYVVASRARGLSPRSVLVNHALRNSSLAIVTVVGLQAGLLLAGAVTVEAVFAWPGVGTLAIQAVQARDLPLVETLVICGASAFVVINSGVDLLCAWIDPRIRRS